jgi:signal transduction histidine kinase
VTRRHEGAAAQFGVALAAEGDETWVEADGDRLLQVASNLVENALRETPAGGTVTVRAEPGRLIVADTGPGIAAEDQPRVFERFERLVPEKTIGGLGLGLWITREIVSALGGTIRVDSQPGQGSSFVVELPRGGPDETVRPAGDRDR